MADKETDIKISVGAVADEKSAEQAVNKIVKKVDGSVKGGRIDIPIDITVPIDETKSKLTKAQKDITSMISKMMTEGFSASGKDMDALNSKLDKFMKAAKEANKDSRNPIVKAISQQVKSLQAQYKELVKVEKANKDYETKVKRNTTKTKSKRQKDLSSNEKIEANIKQHKDRRYQGVKSTGPKDFKRDSGFDTGVATSKTVLNADRGGPYEVKGARQAEISRRKAIKEDAKTLKVRKVSTEEANRMAEEALARGNNKNRLPPEEKAKGIASALLPELAKTLGGIQKGREDASPEKFFKMLEAIITLNQEAGVKAIDNAMSAINMTFHKWFNTDGALGVGDGEDKIDQTRAPKVEAILKGLLDRVAKLKDTIQKQTIAVEEATKVEKSKSKTRTTVKSGVADNSIAGRVLANLDNTSTEQSQKLGEVATTNKKVTSAIENQTSYDKIEHSAERVADSAAGKKNDQLIKDTEEDSSTGFNTDTKADKLIDTILKDNNKKKTAIDATDLNSKLKEILNPCATLLQSILKEVQSITKNGVSLKGKNKNNNSASKEKGLIPISEVQDKTKQTPTVKFGIASEIDERNRYAQAMLKSKSSEIEDEIQKEIMDHVERLQLNQSEGNPFQRSSITTAVKDPASWFVKLKDTIADLTGTTANYKKILAATSEEQDNLNAERLKTYGLNSGRFPAETGDKIKFTRSMSLWRGKDKFEDMFKNFKITPGVKVDTTEISDTIAKTLSGSQMFKAQTGGWKNNLAAAATGGLAYFFQPSLEKTRAQADAVNTIMAEMRDGVNSILQDILDKESKLSGMQAAGDIAFNSDGSILRGTSEAKAVAAQLEESKVALASLLGDVAMVDQVTAKTHGRLSQMVKLLGFTSPTLRKNNKILANINAGLDKNGKALKFQKRSAEILNYSFQLMGRHVGQVFKNMMMMLNPINLLKKAFSDFSSYNTKWQRTLNVVKYNLRAIIRPFMEWLAQQLMNILGVINAIIKGIGQAFGKSWDLFDQSAANAEKMREELEAAANVTAGFDELHDIGSNNSGANDLMGDIYTPQWGDLYDTITDKAKKITEFLIPIFEALGNILKWCLEHWKLLVAAFAAFKIAQGLWNLLNWGKSLRDVFKSIDALKFGNLLSWLAIIAGAIIEIKTLWDSIKWAKDFYGMNSDERMEKGNKNIKQGEVGGALIGGGVGWKLGTATSSMFGGGLAGGLAGGVTGALIGDGIAEAAWGAFNTGVSMWKGETKETKEFSKKMGEGIGKAGGAFAGAKLGAAIGTAFGPIGTAVGAGLGAVVGWAAGGKIGEVVGNALGDLNVKILDITRGVGDFQKMRVNADDVGKAFQNASEKTQIWNEELSKLEQLEYQTGENGKELYDAVENGTKSYWGLNDAQKAVYDQYKNVIEAENQMKEAKLQSLEVSAKYEEQLAKDSGDYKKYIATMQDGMEQGIISQKDMTDYFAQTYGKLNSDAKEVFVNQLPAYIRQSVKDQGAEYETFGNKVSTFFKDWGKRIVDDNKSVFTSMADGWRDGGLRGAIEGAFKGVDTWFANSANSLKILNATEEDAKVAAEQYAEAQENQNRLQKELDQLQQNSSVSAQELYSQLAEGKISYTDLTSSQQELVNKYGELQQAMATTDECALNNVTTMASIDLQAAKTSGDYSTFIDNLVAANERGEIDTDEMETLMAQAYADMDTAARISFEDQAAEHGIMVENVRTKSDEYLGILGQFSRDAGLVWEGFKESVSTKAQEMWKNVTDKFEDIKKKAGEKWNDIKTTASQKWDEIKNSAIGQKVQEVWKNTTTKFNEIKNTLSTGWNTLKSNASIAWNNIKNSIVDAAKNAWNGAKGFFDKIGEGIKKAWDGLKGLAQETGQRIGNFFSGNGFKTDSQVNARSVASFAVGTNYVPHDGLAYIHKGEAVVPAKYNQPFNNGGDNTKLENAITFLTKQVEQLGNQVNQGINVTGQFVQRGSDLVATVQKANNKLSNNVLNNKVYAR